ncbi:hypothetical protein [Amycolatopsis sp. NPDC058986]|uniref:hypothetical protein n=1 Tax=unclassified Amycolatopsis TaxID=2618356 RepID=UPI00366EB50D
MTEDTIDPDRLVAAAHELAHAAGFRRAGVAITEIRVYGHGDRAAGHVDVAGNVPIPNPRLYFAAVLAGRVADLRWCEENGLPQRAPRTCADDMRYFRQLYREWRRKNQGTNALWADARALVRDIWPRLVLLAPSLAVRGRLALSKIPN